MSDIILNGPAGGELPASPSAVSWGAVFAGGVSAAAVAAILGIFGAGLGLASVSPWRGEGVSIVGFTALAAVWLIVVQWVASFVGGYLAGRLRTKYVAVHTDEVFFRDTAHGFLAWALSVLFLVGALGAAGTSTATLSAGAAAATTAAAAPISYYTGLLYREPAGGGPVNANPSLTSAELDAQASVILTQGVANDGNISADDQAYLAQLVTEKTGLNTTDAQARVSDVVSREQADIVKAKQVADKARKATSGALIYGFVSLLIGGFIASVAGAVGGRLRDNY